MVVHVDVYPSRNTSATGTVVEVVGHEGDPDMRMRTLIRSYGLETAFSEASLEQADAQTLNVEDALLQEGGATCATSWCSRWTPWMRATSTTPSRWSRNPTGLIACGCI